MYVCRSSCCLGKTQRTLACQTCCKRSNGAALRAAFMAKERQPRFWRVFHTQMRQKFSIFQWQKRRAVNYGQRTQKV
ncbi:hypothetical protein T01_7412 [Trichinella spiralis]|uniref:Uncharacterized protein n=1 Tax=Trichinella spiralis TaxID=6334 RepID=A0A0V1B603_TRISP|nr:hypothetical protein T01_7412 [Trichinella spiralis]